MQNRTLQDTSQTLQQLYRHTAAAAADTLPRSYSNTSNTLI